MIDVAFGTSNGSSLFRLYFKSGYQTHHKSLCVVDVHDLEEDSVPSNLNVCGIHEASKSSLEVCFYFFSVTLVDDQLPSLLQLYGFRFAETVACGVQSHH